MRYDPIFVGSAAIAAGTREKFWIVFTIYADESGTHDITGSHPGSDVVAIAGYGAWERDWKRFDPQWLRIMQRHGIESDDFKMSAYRRRRDYPYRNWDDAKHEGFLDSLIETARRRVTLAVGGVLVLKDYNEVVPANLRRQRHHPYDFCFQLLIDMLLSPLENILPQGQQVAFIFDQQNEFAPRALTAYQEIKGLRDRNNRLGSIQFRSRIGCPPLQAADMLVGLIRDAVSRTKKGIERPRAIERLTKDRNVLVGYFDSENLPKYVKDIRSARVDRALWSSG
jgi:hypothetical protein